MNSEKWTIHILWIFLAYITLLWGDPDIVDALILYLTN